MNADEPLVGLGIIFPEVGTSGSEANASYYSVRPDWTPRLDEEVDIPEDTEGSSEVDGAKLTEGTHGH